MNMEEPPCKGNDNPTADIIGGDIQDTEPTVELEPFEGSIGAMTKFWSPSLEKDRDWEIDVSTGTLLITRERGEGGWQWSPSYGN